MIPAFISQKCLKRFTERAFGRLRPTEGLTKAQREDEIGLSSHRIVYLQQHASFPIFHSEGAHQTPAASPTYLSPH